MEQRFLLSCPSLVKQHHVDLLLFDQLANLKLFHDKFGMATVGFLNPALIMHHRHVLLAGVGALIAQESNTMRMHTLFQEVVVRIASSNHTPTALRKFAVTPADHEPGNRVLLVMFNAPQETVTLVETLAEQTGGRRIALHHLTCQVDVTRMVKEYKVSPAELQMPSYSLPTSSSSSSSPSPSNSVPIVTATLPVCTCGGLDANSVSYSLTVAALFESITHRIGGLD